MEENLYDMYLAGGKDFAQTKTNDSNNNDQNGIRMISLTQDGMYLTAFWSRCICGFGIENRFDPIYVMENIIPQFDPDYNYKIVNNNLENLEKETKRICIEVENKWKK